MKKIIVFLSILLACTAAMADANSIALGRAAATLPIQHEGRIKPLDSFARTNLQAITGKETWNGIDAMTWLMQTLLAPDQAMQNKIFRIQDISLRQQLLLPDSDNKTYSLAELLPGLEKNAAHINALLAKDDKSRSREDQAWLDIADKSARYMSLLGSANMFLPLSINQTSDETYVDIMLAHPNLEQRLRNLVQTKGTKISQFKSSELSDLKTGMRMAKIRQTADRSDVLRILPPHNNGADWRSPWAAIAQDTAISHDKNHILAWQKLAGAYRNSNPEAFTNAVHEIHLLNSSATQSYPLLAERLWTEVQYHQWQPLRMTSWLYACAFLLLLLAPRIPYSWIRPASSALAATALLLHTTAIGMRIFILMRAPVATLYETALFVSLILAAAAFALRQHGIRNGVTPMGYGFAAITMFFAPFLSSGDSLELLVAVLNTNFWLSTHVICITAAYGACIIASITANGMLWQRKSHRTDTIPMTWLHRSLLISLFLTAFGTVLGGIWADQSWGRFWGWDPKENGALLIVLWITWLLHGRVAGKLPDIYFIALSAALSIIVALSWFGVNLLNTGLHSYGFIEGVAVSLFVFCATQTIFISYCLWHIHAKKSAT